MSVRLYAARSGARPARRRSRTAVLVGTLVFAITAVSSPAAAQRDGALRASLELRPVVGAFIATGSEHRAFVKDGFLLGGQVSWLFSPQFAATGNFAWSGSDSPASPVLPIQRRLNVYQYDVGIEGRTDRQWDGLGGFAGLGVGGRTYHLDAVGTNSHLDGYAALGGDYALGRTAVRIEGRDYISRFRPFEGGNTSTRNDVSVTAGVTFRL